MRGVINRSLGTGYKIRLAGTWTGAKIPAIATVN